MQHDAMRHTTMQHPYLTALTTQNESSRVLAGFGWLVNAKKMEDGKVVVSKP